MKQKQRIDVYCDGSYRQRKARGGLGWVIRRGDSMTENHAPLPKDAVPRKAENHGSDIAELFAVKAALDMVPAGSHILLRMDCQNVIDWLKAGRLSGKPEKMQLAPLHEAFQGAMDKLKNMGAVEIVKASDRNNEYMARAHILSRTASTPLKVPRSG